jgi:hypothetical protein
MIKFYLVDCNIYGLPKKFTNFKIVECEYGYINIYDSKYILPSDYGFNSIYLVDIVRYIINLDLYKNKNNIFQTYEEKQDLLNYINKKLREEKLNRILND